jgi:glycosyltransferase involved in cell wall biosynthesis
MPASRWPVRVSVVIPSFNHAAFVGQAIESVLAQDVDLELLVVDDASADQSRDVIASFSDPRLRFLPQAENRGPSAALNVGIAVARGQYVTALGSDDFYLPGTLRTQLSFLDGHSQYDAVFGLPRLINENGKPLNIGYREFSHPFIGKHATRFAWLRHFFLNGNCLCHPTVMMRRRVHDVVGLYDPRLLNLQDFDLWVRMLVRGLIFFTLPVELTARRIFANNQNLSSASVPTALRSKFELLQVLKSYRSLSASDLGEVFAHELQLLKQPGGLSAGAILASIASHSRISAMQYFALESLYESFAGDRKADCRPLFALAGRLDPFGVVRRSP